MKENLQALLWWCVTILSLFAVGAIRGFAKHCKNKWVLWLLVIPLVVLGYELWFVIARLTVAAVREWRQLFFLAWCLFTFYLWERGNGYKEQAELLDNLLRERQQSAPS